jgi:hypothetical protein
MTLDARRHSQRPPRTTDITRIPPTTEQAEVDDSEKARQKAEAERVARREQVALAGGQLVNAAFSFLGQLQPSTQETSESRAIAGALRSRLSECLDKDEHGRPRRTVTLPDDAALDGLAHALAALLTRPGAGRASVAPGARGLSSRDASRLTLSVSREPE